MTSRVVEVVVLAGLLALTSGCAKRSVVAERDVTDANDTGTTLRGQTEEERALLTELPRLPVGAARRVRGASVVAEAPYEAASGRRCRALRIQSESPARTTERLACTEGKAWFFVPNVFGASNGE